MFSFNESVYVKKERMKLGKSGLEVVQKNRQMINKSSKYLSEMKLRETGRNMHLKQTLNISLVCLDYIVCESQSTRYAGTKYCPCPLSVYH